MFQGGGDIIQSNCAASSSCQHKLAFVRRYGSYMRERFQTVRDDGKVTSKEISKLLGNNGKELRRVTGKAGFKRLSRLGSYCLPYQSSQ